MNVDVFFLRRRESQLIPCLLLSVFSVIIPEIPGKSWPQHPMHPMDPMDPVSAEGTCSEFRYATLANSSFTGADPK